MSSRHLLVLMALTSILVTPGAASSQIVTGDSLAALLLRDEIEKAEERLAASPRTAETVAFQGEIAFRKGHFDLAESLYRTALEMDEKTARAHFGLARLAAARLKTAVAADYLFKAVELDPAEPLYRLYLSDALLSEKKPDDAAKHLREYLRLTPDDPDRVTGARAGLEVLTALAGVAAGAVEAPPRPAPVKLTSTLNLIFTEITLNGHGPFRFVVDTGASQTVIGEGLARELGLKPLTSTVMHGVGGAGKIDSIIYHVERLKVGDVTVRDLPVGTFDNPMVNQLADGILGTATLSDFVITFNYAENQMELATGVAENQGLATIPVWSFSNLLLVPLEVNGHRGNFLVDTGAVSTVLSHSFAKRLGFTPGREQAASAIPLGGIGGLAGTVFLVPNVTLNTPDDSEHFDQVVAIDLQEVSRMIQTEISGIVGNDFLGSRKVTLDYSRAEIRWSR